MFHVRSASKGRRYIPGGILVVFFSALSVLFILGDTSAYRGILLHMGINPFYFPFLDTHGILATAECHRLGIDVLTDNPCDVLGRTLDYSPFWLITSALGLGTGLTMSAGLVLDLVFLLSVFFLPGLKSWTAVWVMTAALLSSAVALGLERANLDLAIFVIALLAAGWSLRGSLWRSVGYALITLAALVKYYPGIMLLLAVRERVRFFLPLVGALFGVAMCFAWFEGATFLRALHNIEKGSYFTTSFGARTFPQGLAYLIAPGAEHAVAITEFVFACIAAAYAYTIARLGDIRGALQSLPPRERNLMLIGCALLLGCFFASQNAAYRSIYFLFILPGLVGLWREVASSAARHRLMLLTGAILFLMWDQFLRLVLRQIMAAFDLGTIYFFALWFLREAVWWWVVSILLAILADLIAMATAGESAGRDHLAPAPAE